MNKNSQPNGTKPLSKVAKEMAQENAAKRQSLYKILGATTWLLPLLYVSKIESVAAGDLKKTTKQTIKPVTKVQPSTAKTADQSMLIRGGRVPDLPGVRHQQVSPSSQQSIPSSDPKK